MPFTIVRQDIPKMNVDAIVNAANTGLKMGGGVCGAIFQSAGAHEMQAACDKLAPIKTGEATITPGYALPAKYVVHAAGPVYHQWSPNRAKNSCALPIGTLFGLLSKTNVRALPFLSSQAGYMDIRKRGLESCNLRNTALSLGLRYGYIPLCL